MPANLRAQQAGVLAIQLSAAQTLHVHAIHDYRIIFTNDVRNDLNPHARHRNNCVDGRVLVNENFDGH
jgi:hypothetical protein